MADSKISALSAATAVAATDQFVVATGGATKKVSGQVMGVCSGTSMPTGATNDRVFRTDLGLEFFYDGTRWLTTNQYQGTFNVVNVASTSTASFTGTPYIPLPSSSSDIWVESVVGFTYVVTNSGSAYWTVDLIKLNVANSATVIGSSFNTSADTQATNVIHSFTVGASVDRATYPLLSLKLTKTSTPGNIYAGLTVNYRLIGT